MWECLDVRCLYGINRGVSSRCMNMFEEDLVLIFFNKLLINLMFATFIIEVNISYDNVIARNVMKLFLK